MNKCTVKRCIRPQCMAVYQEKYNSRFCDCGALLQLTEMELMKPVFSGKAMNKKVSDDKNKNRYLYLLLENGEEIRYRLGKTTSIGRASDVMQVDIDLTNYAGNQVSRKHAVITQEADGCYITNYSKNHSVHVNKKALAYGQKIRLQSEDSVILSRKILFQYEENELVNENFKEEK